MHLSNEVRARLDVTKEAEEVQERDLFRKDMQVRTEDANKPAGEEPLRGLPAFEVELGKHGRAYAVEPGVKFEPPAEARTDVDATKVDASPAADGAAGPAEIDAVAAAEAAEMEVEATPADDAEKGAGADVIAQRRPDAEPRPPTGPDPPDKLNKAAEAYKAAAELNTAPGGFAETV